LGTLKRDDTGGELDHEPPVLNGLHDVKLRGRNGMGVLSDFSLEHSLAVTSTSPGLDLTPGLDGSAFTSSALGCSLGRLSSDSIDSSKQVSTQDWLTLVV